MTQEQLQELKQLDVVEIIRRYLPLFKTGKISKEQYFWLLDQGKPRQFIVQKEKTFEEQVEQIAVNFKGIVVS